jgi:hypothetical protein
VAIKNCEARIGLSDNFEKSAILAIKALLVSFILIKSGATSSSVLALHRIGDCLQLQFLHIAGQHPACYLG